MRARNREYLNQECGSRLESMLQRMAQVRELAPWLNPEVSYAEVRRTAHRLRTGALHSFDPRIPAYVLADMLERAIEQDMVVRAIVKDMNEYREIANAVDASEDETRRRSRVSYFHRLKQSPEASDPESPVAERVRQLSQKRRKEMGRPE